MYQFRSQILSLCDYRDIPLEGLIEPFQADTEEIQAEIERLRKRNAPMQAAAQVAEGDFVTLSCVSQTAKFNKPSVSLNVGKYIFSRELEAAILDLACGEEKTVEIDGSPVTVCIQKIQRRVLPELSDELVESWNLDGILNLQALWESLEAQQKNTWLGQMQEGLALYLSSEVCKRSSFRLDEAEVEAVKQDSYQFATQLIRNGGFDPDTVTDEELAQNCGRTKAEHFAFIQELGIEEMQSALIGCKMMEADGVSFTREAYETALAEQMEYFGYSKAQAEEKFPPFRFAKQFASNYKYNQIEAYAQNYMEMENVQ